VSAYCGRPFETPTLKTPPAAMGPHVFAPAIAGVDLVAPEVQGPARPIDGGVSQQRGDKANEERQRREGVLWRCPL
jgi:hypothetical protein